MVCGEAGEQVRGTQERDSHAAQGGVGSLLMPEKEFFIWLESATILAWRENVGGITISFRVVLLAEIDGQKYCAARYDCAHGTPHQDILGLRGETLAKHWFFGSSNEEVFQYAIRDFQSNAEEYIRFFRRN